MKTMIKKYVTHHCPPPFSSLISHFSSLFLALAFALPASAASYKSCTTWQQVKQNINGYDIVEFSPGSSTYRRFDRTVYVSRTVTLDLDGNAVRRYNTDEPAIVVQNGGTLTLVNGSLSGYGDYGRLIVIEKGGKLILNGAGLSNARISSTDGAAVMINAGGTFEMKAESTIVDCIATKGSGGAVWNNGGTFTMSGGWISECEGTSTGVLGGAVRNTSGTFNMTGGTIQYCYAAPYRGGAVYNFAGATFNMSGGTIKNCSAADGGGVYNAGTFTMTGAATITDCSANTSTGAGGNIYNAGTMTINGTMNLNSGKARSGGSICNSGTATVACSWIQGCSAYYGGAVCCSGSGASLTLLGGNIYGNSGDAGCAGAALSGGYLKVNGANVDADTKPGWQGAMFAQGGTIELAGGDIKNGTANTGEGGGAVTLYDNATFKMTGGWMANNKTTSGNGGAVYLRNSNCTFEMSGGDFYSCSAPGNGGAAWIGSGTFKMTGGTIRNCAAANGGVIAGAGTMTLSGGTIRDSSATGGGGGIYMTGGTLNLTGGTISGCSAAYGGGVRISAGTTTLSGTTIKGNRSNGNGNGLQADGTLVFNMTGGEISGNYDYSSCAYGSAAILAWNSTTVNISGGKIINNKTAGNGVIYFRGAEMNIYGGVFTNNTVTGTKLFYRDSGATGPLNVCGLYSDLEPSSDSSGITFPAGYAEQSVGSKYVAGRNVSVSDGSLAGGTYTFDPSAALYTDAGLSRLATCTVSTDSSATPTWYTLKGTGVANASTWRDVKVNLEAGNSVKLTQNVSHDSIASLTNAQEVALDLNGHTIAQGAWGECAGYVIRCTTGSAKVTIKDSVGTGAIVGNPDTATTAGSGGGFYFADSSSLTLEGGTLKNFRLTAAGKNGGCICVDSPNASFTMNGGAIENCSTTEKGGAVSCDGTFTMTGGVIKDNTAATASALYLTGSGLIQGEVVKGSVVAGSMKAQGGVFDQDPASFVDTANGFESKQLSASPALWIVGKDLVAENPNLKKGVFIFDPQSTACVAAGVTLASGHVTTALTEPAKLYVVDKLHKHCLCGEYGCAHTAGDMTFKPWMDKEALPTVSDNWYLFYNVAATNACAPANGVKLCLNGKTVTGKSGDRIVEVAANRTVSMTDCQTTGLLTGGGADNISGGAVLVNGTLGLFGGSITGNVSSAGAVAVTETGSLVLGGRPVVTNNVTGGNLYLASGRSVVVSETVPLAEDAKIGVTTEDLPAGAALYVPVTSNGNEHLACFTSDDARLEVVEESSKVQLKAPIVTYQAWGGSFSNGTEKLRWSSGVDHCYAVPAELPVRKGYDFVSNWYHSWTNGAASVVDGAAISTNDDHTVYAHWVSSNVEPSDLNAESSADGLVVKGTDNEIADGVLALPDLASAAADAKPFVKITDYAFTQKNYDKQHPTAKVASVAIPTYVREIGSYAFSDCKNLTNVTLAATRDYTTGKKVPLVIRDWAFKGSPVSSIVFPADSSVELDYGSFADARYLKDIYILGEVTVTSRYPFLGIGRSLPSGQKVRIHLSPALAADAAYVASLTNGMNYAHVELSQKVEGEVKYIGTPDVTSDPMVFTFTIASDSPWMKVTEDTVYLFWSKTLPEGKVFIGNEPKKPTTLVRNTDGSWTATFDKPAEAGSGLTFFQLCIGD